MKEEQEVIEKWSSNFGIDRANGTLLDYTVILASLIPDAELKP
ncbi:MAG: hypothetical protein ACXADY_16405 [Candidatus Hodarchaeales archaeon]|jgi:hypothetical protein